MFAMLGFTLEILDPKSNRVAKQNPWKTMVNELMGFMWSVGLWQMRRIVMFIVAVWTFPYRLPQGNHSCLTACRKEAKHNLSLLLAGPYRRAGTTLANRLVASCNYKLSWHLVRLWSALCWNSFAFTVPRRRIRKRGSEKADPTKGLQGYFWVT